jgi:pyruvate formate lyase activating enzyme
MKCNYCEWRCDLKDGKFGVCKMYELDRGVIRERFPNRWSAYGISQIESVPFYHAYPGSRSMTIGTTGCNFNCRYCSNSYIAKDDPALRQDMTYSFSAEELVKMAVKLGCHNIIFNVNEPTVSLPSMVELSREARKHDLPMGCLTNAYMTEETAGLMAEIFSFFNIGLKGLSAEFCREFIGIPNVDPVLRNIRRYAETCHVEIVTPVIQSVNDHEIPEIASFIADVDREIPWHAFRLLPEYQMKDAGYPNIETINEVLQKAREQLVYVYFHNFVGSEWVNTNCPSCGAEVIRRTSLGCGGDRLDKYHANDKQCPSCGHEIRMLGTKASWNSREVFL